MLRRVRDPDDHWAHTPWVNFDEWRTIWLLYFTDAELKEKADRAARQLDRDNILLRKMRRNKILARNSRRFVQRRPPVDIDQPSILATVLPSLAYCNTPHPLAAVLSSLAFVPAAHSDSPCRNPASPASVAVEPMIGECATQ